MTPTPLDTRLPSSIQEFWRSLHAEVAWLHCRWLLYKQLFGTSQERLDILNHSSPLFFRVQHDVMLNDIQLSLGKINDPAKACGHANLSLAGLAELLKSEKQLDVLNIIIPIIVKFNSACKNIKTRRNKWIAHFDLETMLKKQISPLIGPSRTEIELALEQLRMVMNVVAAHYFLPETVYDGFVTTGGGDSLVSTLQCGIRYEQLLKERIIRHNDLEINFKLTNTKN